INKLGQLFDSLYTGGGLTNVELNNFYEEGTFTASDGFEGNFGINFPIRRGFFNDDPNASGWDIYTSLSNAVNEGGWSGDWEQLLQSASLRNMLVFLNEQLQNDLSVVFSQTDDFQTIARRLPTLYDLYLKDQEGIEFSANASYLYSLSQPWTATETMNSTTHPFTPYTITVTRAVKNFYDFVVAFTLTDFFNGTYQTDLSKSNQGESLELSVSSAGKIPRNESGLGSFDPAGDLSGSTPMERFADLIAFLYEGTYQDEKVEDDFLFFNMNWAPLFDTDGKRVEDAWKNNVYYASNFQVTFDGDDQNHDGWLNGVTINDFITGQPNFDIQTLFSQSEYLTVLSYQPTSVVNFSFAAQQPTVQPGNTQPDALPVIYDMTMSGQFNAVATDQIADYLGKNSSVYVPISAVTNKAGFGFDDEASLLAHTFSSATSGAPDYWNNIVSNMPQVQVNNFIIDYTQGSTTKTVQVDHKSQLQRLFHEVNGQKYIIDLRGYEPVEGFGVIIVYKWDDTNGDGFTNEDEEEKLTEFWITTSDNGSTITQRGFTNGKPDSTAPLQFAASGGGFIFTGAVSNETANQFAQQALSGAIAARTRRAVSFYSDKTGGDARATLLALAQTGVLSALQSLQAIGAAVNAIAEVPGLEGIASLLAGTAEPIRTGQTTYADRFSSQQAAPAQAPQTLTGESAIQQLLSSTGQNLIATGRLDLSRATLSEGLQSSISRQQAAQNDNVRSLVRSIQIGSTVYSTQSVSQTQASGAIVEQRRQAVIQIDSAGNVLSDTTRQIDTLINGGLYQRANFDAQGNQTVLITFNINNSTAVRRTFFEQNEASRNQLRGEEEGFRTDDLTRTQALRVGRQFISTQNVEVNGQFVQQVLTPVGIATQTSLSADPSKLIGADGKFDAELFSLRIQEQFLNEGQIINNNA
ncbi:hypothetical protein KDK77_10070, partial [bacterium]|nr:hypothetical protein [bacterium]